jgi:hypothetical protein
MSIGILIEIISLAKPANTIIPVCTLEIYAGNPEGDLLLAALQISCATTRMCTPVTTMK